MQFNLLTVQRRGACGLEAHALAALKLHRHFAQPVFLDHALAGIDDQHTTRPIDNQQVIVLDQWPRLLHAHHGRNCQAARDNRGMRCGTAHVGHKAANFQVLELQGIRRGQVMRDNNQVTIDRGCLAPGQFSWLVLQNAQHPFDNLRNVLLALAQIDIFKRLKLRHHFLHLLHHGPFDIAAALANQRTHASDQVGVGQQHHVQINEGGQLARTAGAIRLLAQSLQLLGGGSQRGVKTRQFAGDITFAYLVLGHFEQRMRYQVRMADGNATRYREAMQRKAHLIPPRQTGWQ